jgi:transposase
MNTQATRDKTTVGDQVMYMALELSHATWKVLFANAAGKRREASVAARDIDDLMTAITTAKQRLKLPEGAGVLCCQEAGRDGFWIDRALRGKGIESLIVDSSSIEVARRAKHRKTDRLDLIKLMALLLRWAGGETRVWSVVRVPDEAAEDVRQLSRAIDRLKNERGQHRSRIKSLLATQGLTVSAVGGRDWRQWVEGVRRWNGVPLGVRMQRDLIAEGERLDLVERQLTALKAERDALVAQSTEPVAAKARRLAELGAIAEESSFVFATELFGWRTFANRRELAGSVGLTPTPFRSGGISREQGLSKAGNRRMRTMLIEIAWCWLRYQPGSALSRWWQERFGRATGRARKSAVVALARKLLVALWRYLEHGVVPEGAALKTQTPLKRKTREAVA